MVYPPTMGNALCILESFSSFTGKGLWDHLPTWIVFNTVFCLRLQVCDELCCVPVLQVCGEQCVLSHCCRCVMVVCPNAAGV